MLRCHSCMPAWLFSLNCHFNIVKALQRRQGSTMSSRLCNVIKAAILSSSIQYSLTQELRISNILNALLNAI
ncbi:hypothetical protein FB446DRAFT_754296 [Lentinula raphanica]|nr:hypothetical protein FB446DRAFT_754296 [Lentinula raphanica]